MSDDWPHQFARRLVDGDDRWALIAEFVAWWYGPDLTLEGNTNEEIDAAEARIGVKLPEALRRWYGYAGKSISAVSNNHNHMLLLKGLQSLDETYGNLNVQVENQAVVQWAVLPGDLDLDDPPVYIFMDGEYIGPYRTSVSDWLLNDLIFEAFVGGQVIERKAQISDFDGCARLWSGVEDQYTPKFYITESSLIEFSVTHGVARIAERHA